MNYTSCNGIIYVIKPGDTLYQISLRYGIPLAIILRANPYADIHNLQIGDKICIPIGAFAPDREFNDYTYTVTDNQTIQDVLDANGLDFNDMVTMNPLNTLYLRAGTVIQLPRDY